nr:acetyltransferase [Gammaproteobacteria bacterium]
MNITFKPFTKEHLPLWNRWVEVPHVKNTWFMDGYEPTDKILEKIDGNGHTYPFVILVGDHPIGYIQCCDLYAYRMTVAKP